MSLPGHAPPSPYPLLLEPILLPKVWGGDSLATLEKQVAPGSRVGESWELADMRQTSTSGAGGGAFQTRIRSGPLSGKTLADAAAIWGWNAMGVNPPAPAAGYPILIKFLDARENLSVQVHPSPSYAKAHPGAFVKSECWYVLDAAPGAVIYKGIRPGSDPGAFAASIGAGSVADHLLAFPAVRGECHDVPSGTCHALGAGVLVLEVQTASDTTFRVFDWGRAGRELHIAQAMQCIDFSSPPSAPVRLTDLPGSTLRTPNFDLREAVLTSGSLNLASHVGPLVILEGRGRISASGVDPSPLIPGMTWFIPRGVDPSTRIETLGGVLRMIMVTVARDSSAA